MLVSVVSPKDIPLGTNAIFTATNPKQAKTIAIILKTIPFNFEFV